MGHVGMEVTVPRSRNRSRSAEIKIHWLQEPIPEEDITTIDGIPVTKPARTLLDLATVEPEAVVERCLDDALRRRLVSLSFLERWLEDPRRRRHRGAPVLRRLLEARSAVGVTESPLEARVLTLMRDAGLPITMLQYVVHDEGRFVARLDFAYPEARVGIEAEGFRYHDGRASFDAERAAGTGWRRWGGAFCGSPRGISIEDPQGVLAWVRRSLESRH